jgi:hypothetical protein
MKEVNMRWDIGWRGLALGVALFMGGLFLGSYTHEGDPVHSTAGERLQPVAATSGTSTGGAVVYVPVYSSLNLGMNSAGRTVELAATVSVRNVSTVEPITLEWVRYYDSLGKQIKDYLDKPSVLPPLGSVEFVVQRSDTTGGPGANFLIRWHGPTTVDEPLIEAIMLGRSADGGVSFTSRGRVVKSAPGT